MLDPFNREAVHIAVSGLLTAFGAGKYSRELPNGQRLNEAFLQRKNLMYIVETHAGYLCKIYKETASTAEMGDKRELRLKKSNRSTRKWMVVIIPSYRSNMLWFDDALYSFIRTA